MNGIIYLIQPQEHLCTNIYKLGRSKYNDLRRLNAYLGKSRVLMTKTVRYPEKIEHRLLLEFKKKYEIARGREYFIINDNIDVILSLFTSIIYEEEVKEEVEEEEVEEVEEEVEEEVKEEVEEVNIIKLYKKKREDLYTIIKFIEISYKYKFNDKVEVDKISFENNWKGYIYRQLEKYFLNKRIILKVDLNDINFINESKLQKLKIDIYEGPTFIYILDQISKNDFEFRHSDNTLNKIQDFLVHNCIANSKLYCTLNIDEFKDIYLIVGALLRKEYKYNIIKFNFYYIFEQDLRNNLPYCLYIIENSTYVFQNRNYKFINLSCEKYDKIFGTLIHEKINENIYTEYLYNDETSPLFGNKDNIKKYLEKYYKLTKNLKCINENNYTNEIIILLSKE